MTKKFEKKNSNMLQMVEISFEYDIDAFFKLIVFEKNWKKKRKKSKKGQN